MKKRIFYLKNLTLKNSSGEINKNDEKSLWLKAKKIGWFVAS